MSLTRLPDPFMPHLHSTSKFKHSGSFPTSVASYPSQKSNASSHNLPTPSHGQGETTKQASPTISTLACWFPPPATNLEKANAPAAGQNAGNSPCRQRECQTRLGWQGPAADGQAVGMSVPACIWAGRMTRRPRERQFSPCGIWISKVKRHAGFPSPTAKNAKSVCREQSPRKDRVFPTVSRRDNIFRAAGL